MVRQAHQPEPGRRANSNDLNSKFETIGSFEPKLMTEGLTTEGLVVGLTNIPSAFAPKASPPMNRVCETRQDYSGEVLVIEYW